MMMMMSIFVKKNDHKMKALFLKIFGLCGSNINNGMVGFLVPIYNCCGWGNRILASDGCWIERLGTSGNQLKNLKEKKTRENTFQNLFTFSAIRAVCVFKNVCLPGW